MPSLTVSVDPNPLIETGQAEIHGVVQVSGNLSAGTMYAGKEVTIDSPELKAACGGSFSFETLQGGSVSAPVTGSTLSVFLDNHGNANVSVAGSACTPGIYEVVAKLVTAPRTEATTFLSVEASAATPIGLTADPDPEVEMDDGSVYAVFLDEDDPAYAGQVTNFTSDQLERACNDWRIEPGDGGTAVTGSSSGPDLEAQTTVDTNGNAVFVFEGSGCLDGEFVAITEENSPPHNSYLTRYTILASPLYAAPTVQGTGTCASAMTACTLMTALSQAGEGDTIELVTSGDESNSSTFYMGGFLAAPAETSATSPVTIEPAPGVTDPILDGGGGQPVLTVGDDAQPDVYLDVTGVTIQHGSSTDGGGIDNTGTLTLTNSSISNNSVGQSGATEGGGIYNGGALTLAGSTVSTNSAGFVGGGIYNAGTTTLANSTVSGNTAADGGGLFNSGTMTITSSTVAANTAVPGGFGGTGGGVYYNGTSLTLTDSIISGNSPSGQDCYDQSGPFTDGGYNLDNDGSCGLSSPTDRSDVDPQLGPLGANGGPTQTMALASTSPAVDAIPSGTNGCGTTIGTDQRGVFRPQGPACDIGAYEYETPTISGVSFTGSPSDPTVTVIGSGFGTPFATGSPGCGATGNDYADNQLYTDDNTVGWNAGQLAANCVGLTNVSFSNTEVSFGFGSAYDTNDWILNPGDSVTVHVDGASATVAVAYPIITSVGFTGSSAMPTVTIDGTGFGTAPATTAMAPTCSLGTGTGSDYPLNDLYLFDTTASWTAGQPSDCVGLKVATFTGTQIVLEFGSYYGTTGQNADGWVLNAGDSFTVGVSGATASATVAYPTITSVKFTGSKAAPVVTIKGSGFGTAPATAAAAPTCFLGTGTGSDYPLDELYLSDTTGSWTAGQPTDCVALKVTKYTDTKVVFKFGSYYGTTGHNPDGWVCDRGDSVTVGVAGTTATGKVAYS